MNLIDTVGINLLLSGDKTITETYYMAPEVLDEADLAEAVHGQKMPYEIRPISEVDEFDEASYLNHFKYSLNTYRKRSFYNMRGFGDVSIIATISVILESYKKQEVEQLFQSVEQVVVFTNDVELTNMITKLFSTEDVIVKLVSELK